MRLILAAILAVLGWLLPAGAIAQDAGQIVEWAEVSSAHVGPRNVSIWLPPGYEHSRRRYPVIYMHDGQNIFVPGRAYGGEEWGVDEALARMIGARRTRGAIVVGIWNTGLRGREYLPAAVVAGLPEDQRRRVEATHGGPSLADPYLRFIVEELKPRVDRSFRTRRSASATSIMGSSMGGLISLYALGEYPRVFGQAAALSIHWPLGDPRRDQGADPDQVASAFAQWLSRSRARPSFNRLYVDIGDQTLDAFYPPFHERITPVLAAHGWRVGRGYRNQIYPGTAHNEAAWRARLETPLAFLLRLRD